MPFRFPSRNRHYCFKRHGANATFDETAVQIGGKGPVKGEGPIRAVRVVEVERYIDENGVWHLRDIRTLTEVDGKGKHPHADVKQWFRYSIPWPADFRHLDLEGQQPRLRVAVKACCRIRLEAIR